MEALRQKARELLESGTVQVVIGYENGTGDRVRAAFIRKPDDVQRLIYDERCEQNLAVYLSRDGVNSLGKPAVVAKLPTLRTIVQLAAENQITDDDQVIIHLTDDGKPVDLENIKAVEEYLKDKDFSLAEQDAGRIKVIESLSREERWDFWTGEFERCLKCYACRSACPLCYCDQCMVECNQPQWLPVAPHIRGNLEWHIVRAMHLAGRCINCGACESACPVDIPLNMLSQKMGETVLAEFEARPGMSATDGYALSSYKEEGDKEEFIR
jgi:ferredoxin